MKTIITIVAALMLFGTASCEKPMNKEYQMEHDNFKREIELMKVKLQATEAQLLNVSAELSNLKNELKPDTITSDEK